MRLPNTTMDLHPWRIREITRDFRLEDVWALPAYGGPEDFQRLVSQTLASDPAETQSLPTHVLWVVRDLLGRVFGLGRITGRGEPGPLPIPGTSETTLADRLPADLQGTAADLHFRSLPFVPVFRTDTEFAAEISNHTVHAVMHLAWVDEGDGRYQGQMAVFVKPRGRLGQGYMALITPFRLWIVYPALMRRIERVWGVSRTAQASDGARRLA